jgi:hypothetical protein
MLDVLYQFIVFPVVVSFILGFVYYGLWKTVNPKKQESERTS